MAVLSVTMTPSHWWWLARFAAVAVGGPLVAVGAYYHCRVTGMERDAALGRTCAVGLVVVMSEILLWLSVTPA